MKVRILLHELYREGGGVLTVSLRLAEDLADRGHDVELVSIWGPSHHRMHTLPANVTVTSLTKRIPPRLRTSRRTWLRRWLSRQPSRVMPTDEPRYGHYSVFTDLVLARYLWSLRDGVVVTMQPGLNVALARLGRGRYVRVAQDHRPYVDRPKGIIGAYARYAGRLDAFLALTAEDADGYGAAIGAPVLTMPNSTPDYDGELSDQRSTIVAAAGRLHWVKGFDLLISAWAQVAARHPQWQLRIYGDGKAGERPRLEAQIAQLGLEGSVRLMGFRRNLQAELAKASLFVLSSRLEGYGMVLVEAMACGVPVVSFDCPTGPRDIISHGTDGWLVPNEDVDGLAEALLRAIDLGPEQRLKVGAVARESAQQRSRSVVVTRWEELLEGLLAAKSR